MALWPYAIVVFTHSFYYYYGFFLERMSGASIDTYPFIYHLLLLRPYLRTILPHTAYRISPVPANDFILRMSHITSRNTTLPPCLIPLMSHITSHHIRQRHYAAPCRIPLLLLRPSKKTTLVPYVCMDTYPTPSPIIFTWVCKGCKLLGRWNHLLMVIR